MKLHLGCGNRILPEPWLNVDKSKGLNLPEEVAEGDVTDLRHLLIVKLGEKFTEDFSVDEISINDCSVDEIYCLPPGTHIKTKEGLKDIVDVVKGEEVLTETGYGLVTGVFGRRCVAELIKIIPRHLSIGIETTPEHPFLAIKRERWRTGKSVSIRKQKSWNERWIEAKDLTKGDFIIHIFDDSIVDLQYIDLIDFIKQGEKNKTFLKVIEMRKSGKSYDYIGKLLKIDKKTAWFWGEKVKKPRKCYYEEKGYLMYPNSNGKKIKRIINIDENFMKLIGYYASEGDVDLNETGGSISFSFGIKEKEYETEVINLMWEIFHLKPINNRKTSNILEPRFSSKIVASFFVSLFGEGVKATTKKLPQWMMFLPVKKQLAFIQSYINGDGTNVRESGYSITTTSKEMAMQIFTILLRNKIIPSIYKVVRGPSELVKYTSIQYDIHFYRMSRDSRIVGNRFITQIARVERKKYTENVYNLSVYPQNSYMTDVALVHNCSHVLDHLSRNGEVDKALSEWYRVLKLGGILRVAVSDFEKTVKMYNEGIDLERLWGAIVGGHKTEFDRHGVAFDFNVLKRYLENHGFVDVRRYRWQDFLPDGFNDNSAAAIPKYDLEGYLMSLNVTAKKPLE